MTTAYQSAVLVNTLPISTASQCNVYGSSYANHKSHKAINCCACQCLAVSAVNKSKAEGARQVTACHVHSWSTCDVACRYSRLIGADRSVANIEMHFQSKTSRWFKTYENFSNREVTRNSKSMKIYF
jgi:hypothetical protein